MNKSDLRLENAVTYGKLFSGRNLPVTLHKCGHVWLDFLWVQRQGSLEVRFFEEFLKFIDKKLQFKLKLGVLGGEIGGSFI